MKKTPVLLFFACQRWQHLLLPYIDLSTCGTYFLLNFEKKPTPVTHLLQVMLVDEYKGQKVQDVKKCIQKLMLDKVCDNVHTAASALSILSFSQDWVTRETPGVVLQPSGCFGLLQSTGHCRGRDLVVLG